MSNNLPDSLQNHIDMLDEAIACTRNGDIVNLDAMAPEVDALCAAIAAAPDEVKRELQPRVAGMVARLDMLESELQRLRDRLADDQENE